MKFVFILLVLYNFNVFAQADVGFQIYFLQDSTILSEEGKKELHLFYKELEKLPSSYWVIISDQSCEKYLKSPYIGVQRCYVVKKYLLDLGMKNYCLISPSIEPCCFNCEITYVSFKFFSK
jgi:hypothetical protein